MAILFFEGFNIKNTDDSPYLDPRYWSRPAEDAPYMSVYPTYDMPMVPDYKVIHEATKYSLVLSGYRLDTIPPQFPVPLQLSGVSGLDSDEIYISFRVAGLGHNFTYNTPYPYAAKILTLSSGNKELLSFDVVRTTGLSVQGGSWQYPTQGLGISVKQTGTANTMSQIGLFDLRVDGLNDYNIHNFLTYGGANEEYYPTMIVDIDALGGYNRRFVHLEFFISNFKNTIRMKVEGFDVLNRAGRSPLGPIASGKPFGSFDNFKFYHRGITDDIINGFGNASIENGNIIIDDLAICNNSGDAPNTWMGPNTRILNFSEQAETSTLNEWTPSQGSNDTRLDTNNGDISYISSQTNDQIYSQRMKFKQSFLGNPVSFTGYFSESDNIGAIRIFNSVRKTFLDSDFVNVYGTGNESVSQDYVEVGDRYVVDHTNYFIRNSFVVNNPHTNLPWTTGTLLTEDIAENTSQNTNGMVKTLGYFGVKKL